VPKHGIGIDPGNSHAVVDALTAAGFEQEQMAAVSQGWRLGGAIKLTERKLAERTLWHAGQALMAWCVGNAKIEPRGNAILITKQASGFAKIDPLMALLDAAELMARAPEPAARSFYDDPEASLAAFLKHKAEFDALLAELQQASADHFGADPEGVLWGEARAVQRCAASGLSPGRNRREENGGGALEAGFPERRNSDSWGGNRGGGCRDRVLTAAGPAGGGA